MMSDANLTGTDVSRSSPRRASPFDARTAGRARADMPAVIEELMAAGTLLPEQMPAASVGWSPEKRLAAAALTSALTEIRAYYGRPSYARQVAETLEWVRSDETAWPFAFLRLCALFDLDADWVRAAVERWTRLPQHEREPKRVTFSCAA